MGIAATGGQNACPACCAGIVTQQRRQLPLHPSQPTPLWLKKCSQIGPEIFRIFQADTEPEDGSFRRPRNDGSISPDFHGRDEAARSSPGRTDGEDLEV